MPEDRDTIVSRYRTVRAATERLCEPLEPEDCCIQSMPDASPAKWHLAHTSWFFETFVLKRAMADYRPLDPAYGVLFNSYYNTVGRQHARPMRGILSRPTMEEVRQYRSHVDGAMQRIFDTGVLRPDLVGVIETGIHHEQQHQELILMDIKHAFSCNPLYPAYRTLDITPVPSPPPLGWIEVPEQLTWIGHDGSGFAFDNESPRHRTFIDSFQIADRLVTCGEYLAFIEDKGYQRPELWLSDGWRVIQQRQWQAPLYWQQEGSRWHVMTLSGIRELDNNEPVSHVSYYEADAFARWTGCWLPREGAWETVASSVPLEGNFLERERLAPHGPSVDRPAGTPAQLFGDLWEWTCSPYTPYPGYQPPAGPLGEYNGKFMCSQMVLRGGSYGTPRGHIRPTYRNFFPPDARWPFTGIRLTKELSNHRGQ